MLRSLAWTTALLSVLTAETVADRTFTVVNNCTFTLWPAVFNNPSSPLANVVTGWEAPPGHVLSFTAPELWAGRVWARSSCTFSGQYEFMPQSCLSGGCNGGLLCNLTTGTGVPPATLAEFSLSTGADLTDYYDVSIVDGFNAPVAITNDKGCAVCACSANLNSYCPTVLQVLDSSHTVIGCKTACAAQLSPDLVNDPYCCSGTHDTPATCPSTGIPYYSYFKTACPDAYAYAYDESSGTALFTCPGTQGPNYTITFCPAGLGNNFNHTAALSSFSKLGSSATTSSSRAGAPSAPAATTSGAGQVRRGALGLATLILAFAVIGGT